MTVQVEVNEIVTNKLLELEEIRNSLARFSNEAALAVLGMNNELSKIQRQYDEYHNECLEKEMTLTRVRDTIANNQLETETLIDAVAQIYRLLCRHQGSNPKHLRVNIEQITDSICEEMKLLEDVLHYAGTNMRKSARKTY